MQTFINDLKDSQECVILAFTGNKLKAFCSFQDNFPLCGMEAFLTRNLPAGTLQAPQEKLVEAQASPENHGASFGSCIANIQQNAETISQTLAELGELVHGFAEALRRHESD